MENDREQQLASLMRSAFGFIQSGNPSGAIEALNRAIAIYPDDEEIYYVRGCQLWNINELSAAMNDFEKATELTPEYFEAHINAGVIAINLNLYSKALVHFEHAVRIQPMDARGYFNLGNTYYELKDMKNSIEYYRRAIELNPDYVKARCALIHCLIQEMRIEDAMGETALLSNYDPSLANELMGQIVGCS